MLTARNGTGKICPSLDWQMVYNVRCSQKTKIMKPHRFRSASNQSLPCILVCLWVSGAVFCLFLGIGIRYFLYGWRSHRYLPGEEVILLTGRNQGVFCEKVTLQSAGYLTAKHLRIRDWTVFRNPETRVEHHDIALAGKYYEFRKYRLYNGEWLDIHVCTEKGLTLYTASTQQAFVKLRSDLERGNPCPENPPLEDKYCGIGKIVQTLTIPPAQQPCQWLENGQNFNYAMDRLGWRRLTFSASGATDAFVLLSSNNDMENRGRNLLEVESHKLTYLGGTTEVIAECTQQQQCMVAMDFGSDQAVVLQVGSVTEEPTYPVEIWTLCAARDWFFVLLFGIVPIVILSALSFCVARKFTATHRLTYVEPKRIDQPLLGIR